MNNQIQNVTPVDVIESVVISGDLSKLKPEERVAYYRAVCTSINVNPLTRPFDYITLNGRLILYARKECTDQLRKNNGVSITKLERELTNDVYTVTAYAFDLAGRQDSSIGAVFIGGLKGEALANAMMKAETKSKRRVTLSICGLGMLDETEIETIPEAHPVIVTNDGIIKEEIKPTNGDGVYQAIVDAGLSENTSAAKSTLTRYCKTGYGDPEKAVAWFRLFRGWRDTNLEAPEAASKANAGEVPA